MSECLIWTAARSEAQTDLPKVMVTQGVAVVADETSAADRSKVQSFPIPYLRYFILLVALLRRLFTLRNVDAQRYACLTSEHSDTLALSTT